jgi:hypothetical protein
LIADWNSVGRTGCLLGFKNGLDLFSEISGFRPFRGFGFAKHGFD